MKQKKQWKEKGELGKAKKTKCPPIEDDMVLYWKD